MNKTDELTATLSQDKAQWQEVEQAASRHCTQEAAKLNALFATAEQFAHTAQSVEAKGLRLSTLTRLLVLMFKIALTTGFMHMRLNRRLRRANASRKKIAQ